MSSKNDITGDALKTKTTTDAYREGYDAIFGKKTRTYGPEEEPEASMHARPVSPELAAEIDAALGLTERRK